MFDRKKKALEWGPLGKLVAMLVEIFSTVRNEFADMGIGIEIVGWMTGKEGKVIFVEWLRSLGQKFQEAQQTVAPKLLQLAGTVTIPSISEIFTAASKFLVNTADGAKPKISYVSDNFKTWFSGKTEQPISGGSLAYHDLLKGLLDKPIITELGSEDKVVVTLAEVFHLMCQQSNGEGGALLTNGYANIFYVRDLGGVLRAVDVRWYGHGWNVRAYSVEFPLEWSAGNRVFSRNS